MKKPHLVVVGFGELVSHKYLSCIKKSKHTGVIDHYSIIELESQRSAVEKRLKAAILQPENVFYLADLSCKNLWASKKEFQPILTKLIKQKGCIKVFIATELKAHEEYLRYCVENGIDSLVEKPVLSPMKGNQFDPAAIEHTMADILQKAKKKPANHSVMSLGRYHKVYNDEILKSLKLKMLQLHAPLTSFHLFASVGIWNLYREYETRNDHPYKNGYGILMHSGYHYVDLMAQFLSLNELIFPNDSFSLTLSSFAAFPSDQHTRIPTLFNSKFEDTPPAWTNLPVEHVGYGETDITTTFCLRNKRTDKVITVGTLCLEQTTPSIRAWKDFPEGLYNKNGRVACTTIEAQLSTLFSIHGRAFKMPISTDGEISRIDGLAQVTTRANATLLKNEQYNTTKVIKNYFNSTSDRRLLSAWLNGNENKSRLSEHQTTMRLIQALALSVMKPGFPITINYGKGA